MKIASYFPTRGRHAIHAELKALPEGEQNWRLNRLYWSCQSWEDSGTLPFRADTLAYDAATNETFWHSFPHDPSLGDLGATFTALLATRPNARIDVVRYVPLRRLTFRILEGKRAVLVGKLKRQSRFRDADARLAEVARVAAGRASFRVARPIGVDAEYGLTLQEALPGTSLAGEIGPYTARAILYRLGSVLCELHSLDGAELPAGEATAARADLAMDLSWIAFLRPELSALMAELDELLRRDPPPPEAHPRLCHGDFVPSQILDDQGAWSVIDFDLCHLGDPYQDLAVLLASLPYDIPALRYAPDDLLRRVEAACVAGYEDRSGVALDLHRFLWHRVRTEVYYLGLALKKDWLDLLTFELAVSRLRAFAKELAETQ